MGSDTTTWFENQMAEFEKDPQFQAESALLDVTERICKVHDGQPKGIYRILFWLLNWSANKLIWKTP